MSKREHARISSGGDTHDLRPKRRRESGETASEVDVTTSGPAGGRNGVNGKGGFADGLSLKEASLKLWQTVRDAVQDDRPLATNFLKKPPKRVYPDYYELIAQPIALDDIKRKIETGQYPTLEAVQSDFDLCFDNAKDYNLKESLIWLDARDLQALVHKTYNKLVLGEDDTEKKKPSLSKLIKARLEKVIAKTDTTGRVLSEIFIELPSRKEWPTYYTTIKKPQCLDNISKKIKRKEYATASEFAADVELVFSNAMTFNKEHSIVWEDARQLRDYFRQLMADMPPPYNLPEPTKSAKIKIKPPQATQASSSSATHQTKAEHGPSLTLRVPAHPPKPPVQPPSQTPAASASASTPNHNVLPSTSKPVPPAPAPAKPSAAKPTTKAATPATPAASKVIAPLPSTSAIQAHKSGSAPAKPAPPKAAAPKPAAPVQNISFINTTSHYPHVSYNPTPTPTASTPVAPAPTPPVLRASSTVNTASTAQSPAPAPPLPLNHQLKSVSLRIQPRGRTLTLDHRDGVKNWSFRLVKGESSILISDVTFMADDDDDGSEGEEEEDVDKHEEEEDMDVDEDEGGRNGRTRSTSKRRTRGRPPKSASSNAAGGSSIAAAAKANAQTKAAAAAKAAAAKKKGAVTATSSSSPALKIGELQCKVNGVAIKEMADEPGTWNVLIPVGSTNLEIGQPNGMFWKVYVDRPADV